MKNEWRVSEHATWVISWNHQNLPLSGVLSINRIVYRNRCVNELHCIIYVWVGLLTLTMVLVKETFKCIVAGPRSAIGRAPDS